MTPRNASDKRYDRTYYDRWYRDAGFGSPTRLARKVDYALGVAEYLLDRPVRSVLDIGCGEGTWRAALHKRRPGVTYVGIDPSEYAVGRFGRSRDLRLGGFGDVGTLAADGPFDLMVCIDVAGYVPAPELRRGLAAMADMLDGVAVFEVFARGDDWEGDRVGFQERTAATYDRWFAKAGLHRIGPNLLCAAPLWGTLAALERA